MAEKTSGEQFQNAFLSPEQRKALGEIAERHKAAQRQFTKALGVLWSTQMDMALALQSGGLIERVSAAPLNFFDDCNCCSEIVVIGVPRPGVA